MSKLLGTNIASSIVPFDSEDTYATHEDTYGKGGWHTVVSVEERDAIPQERRKIGMACYVQSEGRVYVLKDGTANNNWKVFNAGGSSTAYTHEQGIASSTWLIQHDLNKKPSITVCDSTDTVVTGEIQYIDNNRALVTFKVAIKGVAYCN